MQAEQETNNKAIAAQILCAFIAKSNVDSLLKEQKSSLVPENLESLWQRILKMVSSGPQAACSPEVHSAPVPPSEPPAADQS